MSAKRQSTASLMLLTAMGILRLLYAHELPLSDIPSPSPLEPEEDAPYPSPQVSQIKLPPLAKIQGQLPFPHLPDIPGLPSIPGLLLPPLPRIPSLLPPGTAPDIVKCWSSLTNIPGCVLELFTSAIGGRFGDVGSDCCKALRKVENSCSPKLFPVNPLFSPFINGCSRSSDANAEENGSN